MNKKIKSESIFNIHSIKHKILIISLIVGIIITVSVGVYANREQSQIAKNLLRLHIIANSDSKEDQALKLKVRDAIIARTSDKFKDSKNIEETMAIAAKNIDNLKEIAKRVIAENGKDYDVTVSIENVYFPTKYYGDLTLPPGNYNALRVQIGQAKGANWWCVLFPPLCFVDVTNGSLPESSKEQLKNSLGNEEYSLITNTSSSDNVPVKIKFKSVELWEKSKHNVEVAFDKIF